MHANRTGWTGLILIAAAILAAGVLDSRRDSPAEAGRTPAAGAPSSDDAAGEREAEPLNAPQARARFHLDQRLAAGETHLPLRALHAAYQDIRARESALVPSPGGIAGWEWLGPGNIGGRTRALVVDPTDTDILYAAGVAGGVWKSTNGGASWSATDDFLLNLAVCSLAMDPTDPNVLYAGTGEGWFLSNVFLQGLGIFKSTDAGASWTLLPGTANGGFEFVQEIVVSPNDSNRIYAATRTGVWRSTDAGATWNVVLSNPTYLPVPPSTAGCTVGCTDLVIRTDTAPDMLFAAFGSLQSDGLYRTVDGGDTWQAYLVPPNQGRTSIALWPFDQDVMYLLMADNGSGGALGQLVDVFQSTDGGDTFAGRVDFGTLTGPWLLSNLSTATGCINYPVYSQGWYDNVIAVDPVNPDVVWVGGVDLFRSSDGGQSWDIAGYWQFYQSDPQPPYYVHADHHGLFFAPDYDGFLNQTLYATNDGGIFRTRNALAPAGQEDCPQVPDEPLPQIVWENLNNGYGVTQFYHGDSARDADVFIAGAQDNGTNRVQAADTPNAWDLVFGGDGGYVAIDPTDSQTVYVEYHDFPTIQKSTDGGDTFVQATTGITDTDGIFITPFALDPGDPQVLWTGGSRPWRTTDGASSWQLAGPDFAGPAGISAIAISPADGNVVYLGFTNGYVARTTDGLAPAPTWEIFANGLFGGWVSSVAVDPANPDAAWCTYSTYGIPHVLATQDGGQSWSSIDGIGFSGVPDIPVHWIAVRPCDSRQLYAATELGVFASDDGGATWNPANAGLAHTVVESLDFQDANTLVAFTHGRGAYRTQLAPCRTVRQAIGPVKK